MEPVINNLTNKTTRLFGRFKLNKDEDPYYRYYNMEYLYRVMVTEICKCLYKATGNLIELRKSCSNITFPYFRNPYYDRYSRIKNNYRNQIIRFNFLDRLSYSKNGLDEIKNICWVLYEDHPTLESCITNAYFISLYSMWIYIYHNDLPDTLERIEMCHELVMNWVSECMDNIIFTVEFQMFESMEVSNPDNLPDLTRQNKVMEYIRWKVIRPLLDLESCSPSSDNKIIPF